MDPTHALTLLLVMGLALAVAANPIFILAVASFYAGWLAFSHIRRPPLGGSVDPHDPRSVARFGAALFLTLLPCVPIAWLLVHLDSEQFRTAGALRNGIPSPPMAPYLGGHPGEVFTHWVDIVFFVSGAISIWWGRIVLHAMPLSGAHGRLLRLARIAPPAILLPTLLALDLKHGECTSIFVVPCMTAPVLIGLWHAMGAIEERFGRVASLFVLHPALLAAVARFQWEYEPSESGAPQMEWSLALLVFAIAPILRIRFRGERREGTRADGAADAPEI